MTSISSLRAEANTVRDAAACTCIGYGAIAAKRQSHALVWSGQYGFCHFLCLPSEIPTFKRNSMKALPRTVRYLVVATGLIIIVAYALAIGPEQGVEVGKNAFVDAKGRTRNIYMI